MNEWKPIDEAPKDGSFFLGRFDNDGGVVIINWNDWCGNGFFAWRNTGGTAVEYACNVKLVEYFIWPE